MYAGVRQGSRGYWSRGFEESKTSHPSIDNSRQISDEDEALDQDRNDLMEEMLIEVSQTWHCPLFVWLSM